MIQVCEPIIGPEEIEAVLAALKNGEISGTFGPSIEKFESEFATYCGCKYGIAVSSGTTALHLAVDALGLGEGDEMLVSASTNIASALAAFHNGVVAVPVDSEDLTWNLNLDLVEPLITPKTRAIMPVHLYGHPVDMDRVIAIAKKHRLFVIEDCAESHGATCRGRMTGSFGDAACFSFYANKVITTGEGGMVVTNNPDLAEKVKLLRNLAFQAPRFYHERAGYNFRMTGLQAAMGRAQLRKIDSIIENKRRLALLYNQHLKNVTLLQLPHEAEWAKNVYWMYGVVLKEEAKLSRDEFAKQLKNAGVDTRTFFCPMNLQPCLQKQPGYRPVKCPVADRLWQRGLYLPSTYTLDESVVAEIAAKIKSILGQ